MDELKLVRDVLDQQIVDREKRNVGKVDGVVVQLSPDAPPRLLYIELGTTVLLRRVGSRVAGWYERLRHRMVKHPAPPFRISWQKVQAIDLAVHVDIDRMGSDVYHLEHALRDTIEHIPGADHGKEEK